MVGSVDFYEVFNFIKLLQCFCCYLCILIFIYYYLLAPPLSWSKVASKFLQFANHHIHVGVTGKRVNHGVGLGLEIPVKCFLWRCKSYNMGEK